MSHTPGSWIGKDMIPICNAHRFGLSIGFVNSSKAERIAEGEANARLIVSAPDLLEALQMTIQSMLDTGYSPDSAVIRIAQSAVSQATSY
ncbi:TPA: hypothetical protein ACXI4M_003885 [Pseudomonas aeruginosa]|uniref:hypothetical protein n=1 Tax=Pseudomonas aeruginosa TaxID=287 RepID=UPI0034A35794